MAKARIEFDLTDLDDRMEFEKATKASDMALTLWSFSSKTYKSTEQEIEAEFDRNVISKEVYDAKLETFYNVYAKFHELMEKYSINLNNLVS